MQGVWGLSSSKYYVKKFSPKNSDEWIKPITAFYKSILFSPKNSDEWLKLITAFYKFPM